MKYVPDSPLWFEREDINERMMSLNSSDRDFSKTCSTLLISSTLLSLWSLMTQRVFLAAASRRHTERLAYTADKFCFEPKLGAVSRHPYLISEKRMELASGTGVYVLLTARDMQVRNEL